jgi:hypothetical protein
VSSALTLLACAGGVIALPAQRSLLADRAAGGHLLANPLRTVWERSALSVAELTAWAHLVAATGEAMLATLPQLEGGCINYWEAGNWALNDDAEPKGPKRAQDYRKMHLHLLGRSPSSTDPGYKWGESPRFPEYADRLTWAAGKRRLAADECISVVTRAEALLREKFAMSDIRAWQVCDACGYPTPSDRRHACGV